MEETSAMLKEIAEKTRRNADTVADAQKLMNDTTRIVTTTNTSLKGLRSSMEEVNQASIKTARIVQTIDSIAFQTNLLALNASVEAARAGDVGGGFAVVSDDIRGLGARSTEAAKNSIALISKTAGIAGNGNNFMGLSIRKFVDYGNVSIPMGTYANDAIAIAMKQLEGVNHVNALIESISKSAQTNAAAAEETSSVAEETTDSGDVCEICR